MKQFILKNKKALSGTIAILLIGAVTMSFQDSPFAYSKFSVPEDGTTEHCCTDTLPKKEGMTMKDFEKLQAELDNPMLQVSGELKKMDLSKIQQDVEASLKNIDMEKMKKDIELAMKNIDMTGMMAEVGSALKNVSSDYTNADVEKALTEAKKELEKAKLDIKEIDKDALKQEMDNAKKELSKAKLEIEKIDMDKIMAEAKNGIDKAKGELKLTREMFTEMEKDGLINSKNGFTIEYKNKDLFIDGLKQTEKTTDKYRKYFKNEDFKIKIDKD